MPKKQQQNLASCLKTKTNLRHQNNYFQNFAFYE